MASAPELKSPPSRIACAPLRSAVDLKSADNFSYCATAREKNVPTTKERTDERRSVPTSEGTCRRTKKRTDERRSVPTNEETYRRTKEPTGKQKGRLQRSAAAL